MTMLHLAHEMVRMLRTTGHSHRPEAILADLWLQVIFSAKGLQNSPEETCAIEQSHQNGILKKDETLLPTVYTTP